MVRHRGLMGMMWPAIGMLVLTLDSKTAIEGASEGIKLCTNSVIPSLFPFVVLSIILTGAMSNSHFRFLIPIGKLCKMAPNTVPLLLIGLLGGYPTGAQAVAEAYRNRSISSSTAHRLLGFCSNAGPAFLFGITGCLFTQRMTPWLLWAIHILSALAVGAILPADHIGTSDMLETKPATLQQALKKALHVMANICGWIILFRVVIAFLRKWFLWLIPETTAVMILGILELTNGIFELKDIESEALRFVISSVILSFGGICVAMQTRSVTDGLGTGWYFPGKMLQVAFSWVLSMIVSRIAFGAIQNWDILFLLSLISTAIFIILIRNKKITVAFFGDRMYNERKALREFALCSFVKR